MSGIIIAKRVILREWKSVSALKWLNYIVSCLYLEEIQNILSNTYPKLIKIWGSSIEHIRKVKCQLGN